MEDLMVITIEDNLLLSIWDMEDIMTIVSQISQSILTEEDGLKNKLDHNSKRSSIFQAHHQERKSLKKI
jgi:hypothetical protein